MPVEKKHVLEVFGEPISNGGQEAFVINVLQHMDHERFRIDFLTPYYVDNEHYKEIVESYGGQVYAFGLSFEPGKSRFNINEKINAFFQEHHAVYDVVHIHSGSISVLAIMSEYAKKNGVPKVIVHSHCAAEKKTLKYRLTKLAMSGAIRRYPTDYCACSLVAGEWKYPADIVKHRLHVIKNGVDLERYSFSEQTREKIRGQLGIPGNTLIMGHVGRFSYQKNHEFLVRVFFELQKIHKDAALVLIGSGETQQEIKSQIDGFGIADKVFFCGNVNNVNEYMQAMDVFVLPSRYEGLPLVGVEAQAAGLPVITSMNVSGELKLSDAVTYLPLKDNPVEWARTVAEAAGRKRQNYAEQIRGSGYDIRQTAAEMERLYLGGAGA